jgi:hypothetical protein
MPGSGTGALPMPRRTGTPTFRTRRSGRCSKRSGRAWCRMSVRSMDSTPSRRRCPRPASCASTRTATRSTPVRSGGPSRSAPMPTAWNAGRTVRSWGGMSAPSVAARRSTIRFITSRFWRANQALAQRSPLQGLGPATGPAPGSAQARTPARRRPAGGRDPRGRAHRRAGGRRSRLLRGFGPQRPFRRRRSEHPGASPRTATAPDNHDAGCTEVGPRARGQLRSLRQPEENREWNDHRCWTPWVS